MLTPINEMSDHQALAEFDALLRECCADKSPPRPLAVRYQMCRMALMAGALKAELPGYVRQCMSSLRFREFIHLYDHDPATRIAFVEGSLRACWTKLARQPSAVEGQDPALPLRSREFDDFMIDRDDDDEILPPPRQSLTVSPPELEHSVIARWPVTRSR